MGKTPCDNIHGAHVTAARKSIPDGTQVLMISELFKLLGDPTRLRIIAALGAQELCVCDVATCLEMTQSAISHQLALLKHARLVRSRRDGKTIFYALDDGHVGDLLRIARKHIEENGDVP